jgi:hypothetical protein
MKNERTDLGEVETRIDVQVSEADRFRELVSDPGTREALKQIARNAKKKS